jgi:colanic acid biosynthesis glycosyl transferase WcaI
MTRRPSVLVLNQYYWPGVESTAHLLSQLCEELALDFDVTVITGCLRERAETPERFTRNGVKVLRVPSAVFERARLLPRSANYLSFLAGALWAGLAAPRPDVVLCMTDPPLVANIALPVARRFGAPLIVVTQDVFPEIAVQLKRLEQPLLVGVLRKAIGFALGRADRVVAIGETMRVRLEEKGVPANRIAVIPNWCDTDAVKPMPRENDWALDHGLAGRFVVMHSGNVGHAQDLDALLRATTLLRDLDDLSVVVIGSGARWEALQGLAARISADAVTFAPFQPADVVSSSLSAADVHFVGLAHGLAGYVVPSRVYGIMAAGKAMIVSADAESETAQLVAEIGCGLVIPPGRPDLVAGAIREARDGRHDLERMGRLGLAFAEGEATHGIAFSRYRKLIEEMAAG